MLIKGVATSPCSLRKSVSKCFFWPNRRIFGIIIMMFEFGIFSWPPMSGIDVYIFFLQVGKARY